MKKSKEYLLQVGMYIRMQVKKKIVKRKSDVWHAEAIAAATKRREANVKLCLVI